MDSGHSSMSKLLQHLEDITPLKKGKNAYIMQVDFAKAFNSMTNISGALGRWDNRLKSKDTARFSPWGIIRSAESRVVCLRGLYLA